MIRRNPLKKKECTKGRECGATCIEKVDNCLSRDPKVLALARRLMAGKKSNVTTKLRKQYRGPVQHMSTEDALLAGGVYSKPNFLGLKAKHPYIKFNKPTEHEVDLLAEAIKVENPKVYTALANKGLRFQKGDPNRLSKEDKVKVFLRLYLQQNGQSFATGKTKSFNNLTIDHIVPISKGGTNDINNLVLIESNINYAKGALSLNDFAKALDLRLGVPRAQYIKALQNPAVAPMLRKAAIAQDRAQAAAWKAIGVGRKAEMEKWKNGGWASLDTQTLAGMQYPQVKNILKVMSKELAVPYSWYTSPTGTGGRTSVPPLAAASAMILAYRGLPLKDVPESWVMELKQKVKENARPNSSLVFLDKLNDEWKKALGEE